MQNTFKGLFVVFLIAVTGVTVYFFRSPLQDMQRATPMPEAVKIIQPTEQAAPPSAELTQNEIVEESNPNRFDGYSQDDLLGFQKIRNSNTELQQRNASLSSSLQSLGGELNELKKKSLNMRVEFTEFQVSSKVTLDSLKKQANDLSWSNKQLEASAYSVIPETFDRPMRLPSTKTQSGEAVDPFNWLNDLVDMETVRTSKGGLMESAAHIHVNAAQRYEQKKNYKKAEAEYRKALFYNANDANIHYALALLNDRHFENYRRAINHYRVYLSLMDAGRQVKMVETRLMALEAKVFRI